MPLTTSGGCTSSDYHSSRWINGGSGGGDEPSGRLYGLERYETTAKWLKQLPSESSRSVGEFIAACRHRPRRRPPPVSVQREIARFGVSRGSRVHGRSTDDLSRRRRPKRRLVRPKCDYTGTLTDASKPAGGYSQPPDWPRGRSVERRPRCCAC